MEDAMPLTGIKVLDLTRVVSGPFCTMFLADFGADVIKVESLDGDPSRVAGIMIEGEENPYFVNLNRSKRSITVNMKNEEGKGIIRRLAATVDVLVENFRPGVMDRLGLGYDELKKLNPRLIYAAISGFGKTGPYKDRPAFDFIAQAMSGFMSLNGSEDMDAIRAGIPITDTIAGIYAAFGILAALRNRDKIGQGQQVHVAMVDSIISMFTFASGAFFATGKLPPRTGNDHMIVSPYGLFQASDGPIAIAPSTHETWLRLIRVLDLEQLDTDPRFVTNAKRMKNRSEINHIIGEIIKTRSRAEWIEILNKAGVPCGPILDLKEVFSDPQVLNQEMLLESPQPTGPVKMPGFPIKLSETPARLRGYSPQIGENAEEVLKELGYNTEEVKMFRQEKAI